MAKILVVEDEPGARRAIEKLLELEKHTPVPAEDGLAALDALTASDGISMVVLDLMMPRMDGVEFLKRIRKDGRWARLPVVVISALSQGPQIEAAKSQGIMANLVKGSWTFEQLLGLIERAVGGNHKPT